MTRYLALLVALTVLTLVFSGVDEAQGATRRKKHPVDTSDDASASTPKPNATPALDLPLPAKAGADGGKSTPAPKKGDDGDAPPPKTSAKVEKSTDKESTEPKSKTEHAPNATVEPDEIVEFAAQPPRIQQLLRDAIDLTRLNLTYTFGSADPDSGGMDCSGTIYYLLKAHNFSDVPRDSSGQYMWVRKGGGFYPVVSKSAESVEFNEMLPGDLMFWTGTYDTNHDVPISHVMMYLGREKGSGKRITFGASDGRSYNGIQRWGVSVFDFKMPKVDSGTGEKSKAEFVGFARIPGLRSAAQQQVALNEKASGAEKKPTVDSSSDGDSEKKATPSPHRKRKKKASSD